MNKQLAVNLYDIGAIKFGEFKLKSGISSPIYIDLRLLASHPETLALVAQEMNNLIEKSATTYDILCGVPLTGIPLATAYSLKNNKPMIMCRKEAKEHGTKKMIEGTFLPGQACLLVEDLITSGMSSLETIKHLEETDVKVRDIVVIIDREQGGKKYLEQQGYRLHALFTLSSLMALLVQEQKIDANIAHSVERYCAATRAPENSFKEKPQALTYAQRAQLCTHPVAQKIFEIMEQKQTNLCVAADVTTTHELLNLIEQIGSEICILKLHIDIIEDYDATLPQRLKALAQQYNFVLFEDRKFADIGATVQKQCSGGIYHITDWAELVTVHTVAGDGTLKGIKAACKDMGQMLLAQMSSEGNLIDDAYTRATVEIAHKNNDCVVGLICRKKLADNPAVIHMTPGVNLQTKGDTLGQQYLTPELVIGEYQSDVIIVGRGITHAADSREAAQQYRTAGWQAYQKRVN